MAAEQFEEVVGRIAGVGSKIAAVRHLNEEERTDLYQEAAQKIAERILARPDEAIENLDGYIHTTLGNALKRRRRHLAKYIPTERHEIERRLDSRRREPDAESTDRTMILAAVNQLPKDLRDVIAFRYYADMAVSDISKLLKISVSTVYKRDKKACELLGHIIEKTESGETS